MKEKWLTFVTLSGCMLFGLLSLAAMVAGLQGVFMSIIGVLIGTIIGILFVTVVHHDV